MKRIRFMLILVILVCFSLGINAVAEERLEIVQTRQAEGQLVLYALLTDADTGDVVSASLNAQQVRAVAGQYGDAQTLSVQPFSEAEEGVAYAVVVDINSYALNAAKLSALQDALGTILNTMRDADRMMLLSVGKTGVKALSNNFEKDRLVLYTLIRGMTTEDKYKETRLYQGVERAIGAFSSTSADFPARKAVLVFTYGADNGSMAAEVLAEKAAKSGVPVYFITLKGKDADGNVKTVDFADLDRIARASHGRVLDGRTDLTAAVTQFSKYISGTSVITVQPSQATWNALSAQWSVSVNIGDQNVTNDGDGNYNVVLSPTAAPSPTASRMISIIWNDNDNQNQKRPDSITVHLLTNGKETGKTLTLYATGDWKGTWDNLADGAEYTVTPDEISGYTVSAFTENAQGELQATATLKTETGNVIPVETAMPTRALNVLLSWEDQDNADHLRPDTVAASVLKNGVDMGLPQTLNADNNWSAVWQNLPEDGADYTVVLDAIDQYTLSEPAADGVNISFTATHAAATLVQKLFSPPLIYVVTGVVALLLVLVVLLLASRKHEAEKLDVDLNLDDESDDLSHVPSAMDLTGDERTRSMFANGEETLGLFSDDAERTLGMEDNRLRIEAEIDYQGVQKQQTLLLLNTLTIGRAKDSGLVLEDPRVSRQHCKLTLKPEGLFVTDLGSRSGTFLNDTQVTAEMAVKTGDTLALGMTHVTLNIRK